MTNKLTPNINHCQPALARFPEFKFLFPSKPLNTPKKREIECWFFHPTNLVIVIERIGTFSSHVISLSRYRIVSAVAALLGVSTSSSSAYGSTSSQLLRRGPRVSRVKQQFASLIKSNNRQKWFAPSSLRPPSVTIIYASTANREDEKNSNT